MANTDILKNEAAKAGKRYLPKVANATFSVNDIPAFIATANTSSQVNIQTTQEQIKAGQNNTVIGTIISDKTIDVSFSTPEWQPEFLAANIGETIAVGKFAFEVSDGTYAVKGGKITLSAVPADKKVVINVNGSYISIPATTTEVDVSVYGIKDDSCVSVIVMVEREGKRINLSADTEPMVGKLVLDSPIFEGTKGKIGTSQYVFPAFALSGNWDHSYGSDASYEISGTAIATSSEVCGEGQSYGYYQEYIEGEDVNSFAMIMASPSAVELEVGEKETLTVYGAKGVLYSKTEVTGAAFATDSDKFTVNASSGEITAVAAGTGTITVTYNSMTTTVDVEVSEKSSG